VRTLRDLQWEIVRDVILDVFTLLFGSQSRRDCLSIATSSVRFCDSVGVTSFLRDDANDRAR